MSQSLNRKIALRWCSALFVALLIACNRTTQIERTNTDSVTAAPIAVQLPAVDSGAPKLLPFDEADSSFRAFRTRLLQALSERDTTFLYSIIAPEIKNSFGGNDSIAGFRHMWSMESGNSEVWQVLTRVLSMGGRMTDSTFSAPYVFDGFPPNFDAFDYSAVVSRDALVYAQRDTASPVLGTTSYAILKVKEWHGFGRTDTSADSTWAHVELPDKRTGWLRGKDVYSPVGWRAFFEKRAGKWTMVFFVAGD